MEENVGKSLNWQKYRRGKVVAEFECDGKVYKSTPENIIMLIKRGMEYESKQKTALYGADDSLYVRAHTKTLFFIDSFDTKLFHKLYIYVIDEYLRSGVIKIDNGKIYYCNTSSVKNPDKEYKEVSIGFAPELLFLGV